MAAFPCSSKSSMRRKNSRFRSTRRPNKPSNSAANRNRAVFITDAAPGAELYVGLKRGVTRERFEQRIQTGTVAECFHRVAVRTGDAMFLPSGRVHALGAGLVLFEIQQNSDTTYRVFDWNRVGLDGKPRALHLARSLASIDFNDFEPALIRGDSTERGLSKMRKLVSDSSFTVETCKLNAGARIALPPGKMQIIGIINGLLQFVIGPKLSPLRRPILFDSSEPE